MSEQLWTSFNDKKFAAERAKYDWNGRELTTITGANNSTISIKQGSNATAAGSFTTNQASDGSITLAAATTSADGVMSSADKTKLDGIATGATKVEDGTANGDIKVTYANGTSDQINVYLHDEPNPGGTSSASGSQEASFGDTAAQTPGFGDTFKVTSQTVNFRGHTTAIAEHTVTIPSSTAVAPAGGSAGSAGLMSAADKGKHDHIEAGAQVNVKPDWDAASGSAAEILNKPNIPTVNDATLTITVAGTASTFTANSSTPTSVSIPNAASASGGGSATGGLMTATDKTNLDTLADATPTGTDAPSSSNLLVTESMLATEVGKIGAFEVVSLTSGANPVPDVADPSTKVIYLTKESGSTATDPYTEWICTNTTPGAEVWEVIGETSIDLSGYKTTQQQKN